MNHLQLFLPCPAGVEEFLAREIQQICGGDAEQLRAGRGGVSLVTSWREVQRINLHSRLAQRVLLCLHSAPYGDEHDIYDAVRSVAWEAWFTLKQTFKVELTAQHSPLKSLNFAALRVKDGIADRFRDRLGARPDVDRDRPHVRVFGHLTASHVTVYIDTSGEPLFKRGWRMDKGDAPLKETLAAAMIAACGWQGEAPLYDPCCGSGTIAIEAAQIACRMAPGRLRRFGFEHLAPFQGHVWQALKEQARALEIHGPAIVFGSDVAHRMVDFAQRNAERAGVAGRVEFRGGDALQRLAPSAECGVMLLNPPYGERIQTAGVAGSARQGRRDDKLRPEALGRGREALVSADTPSGQAEVDDFFRQLASHWKRNFGGWTAWVLTPDLKLPGRMRFKEARRVPMWNGPIECRLFRFDISAPGARHGKAADEPAA